MKIAEYEEGNDGSERPRVVGRLERLWRYPVKSFLGEVVEELELEERGVVGDRLFALRNSTGHLGSGKDTDRFRHIEGLFGFSARYDGAVPVVRFPDGSERRGDDPGLAQALSNALGRSVTFAAESDVMHFDDGPIHMVTTASLRWLSAGLGGEPCDERRFRPNFVLHVPGHIAVEKEWIGQELLVGRTVRLAVRSHTTRCPMTTFAQAELAKDSRVLKYLYRHAEAQFGVYLEVLVPGTVRVGDEATLLGFVG